MQRKIGEEIPLDRRRRIGGERMVAPGRGRTPFGAIKNRSEAANDGGTGTGAAVDFTKEEVEALLNERMKKETRLDTKMGELIKRLKNCVRWFKRVEEGYVLEKEKLQTDLDSAKKKCIDIENEMKIKVAELNEAISNLRMTISSSEEKIAKEESDKLEAIECYRKEKEARNEAEQKCVQTDLKSAEKKCVDIGGNEGRMRNLVSSFPEIQDEVVDLYPQGVVDWSSLPDDIVIHLLSCLGYRDRASLSASCKKWRVLGNSPCLWTSLDLHSHKFDVNVASSLASRCVHLQKLRFTGTKASEALPHLRAKNLRELSVEIWDNDIEAAFIVARHELLQSLQFVQFSYNSITSDGIIAIARGCPSLNQLRLSGIVDVNADAINALATYCPKLTDIAFIDCEIVDELALGNVQSVRFLSVAGTPGLNWSVVSDLWHKLPNLTGLDVSGTDIGPSAVSRLLSLSPNLKILIALGCRILKEETSFSASKYKNKLLISLSTDIFKGLGSLFFDNTNGGNNVFLDRRTSKSNNDKGIDEIIPWLEWMLSYSFSCFAAQSPQQGGLDNFWVEQVASLFVSLMQSSQEDVQEMAATDLATFVRMDDSIINCGRAEAVIRYGGIRLLLGLAKSYREGLQFEAAKAIASLSTNANVVKAIVEEGGIEILISLARSMNKLVAEKAAKGLWNISMRRAQEGYPDRDIRIY